MGRRPICFGLPLKHYDYESIQISACRPYGRPHGLLGGLVRTVAAHKLVVLIFKTDDLIFYKTKFFKFKKYLFPDAADFSVDSKAPDSGRYTSDVDFIVFTVKHIARHWQAG